MNPYQLAICEDEALIREELLCLCSEILKSENIDHTITAFSSAKELEKQMSKEEKAFDLLILDIQMEGMTGMELAHTLRRREDRVSIIFITGCEEYLPEGYTVQPVHFLLKPVSRESLAEALRIDWKLNHRPKTVLLRMGKKTVSLFLADICYVESYNHSIVVHKAKEELSFLLSLSQAEQQLPSGQFCRCHNSYLVNLEYVEEIGRMELFLRGGARLPVGRKYYKEVQNAFIRYMNQ